MNLTPQLQEQVRSLAKDPDLAQDCFVVLWQRPEKDSRFALRIAKQTCTDQYRRQAVRKADLSIDQPDFVEPVCQGESVDVDRYIDNIKNRRLRSIVDQYVDGEKPVTKRDRDYLSYHRKELDRDLTKYLKPKSAWQWFIEAWEPYHRTVKQLIIESVRIEMVRAQ